LQRVAACCSVFGPRGIPCCSVLFLPLSKAFTLSLQPPAVLLYYVTTLSLSPLSRPPPSCAKLFVTQELCPSPPAPNPSHLTFSACHKDICTYIYIHIYIDLDLAYCHSVYIISSLFSLYIHIYIYIHVHTHIYICMYIHKHTCVPI